MTAAAYQGARPNLRDGSMSPLFLSTAFLLLIAMLFGGGGKNYPLAELVVEIAALPALGLALWRRPSTEDSRPYRLPLILFFAAFLLILLQILPLPPSFWQALPGREPFVEIAKLAGQEDSWRSWSLDPQSTFRTGLSYIVPLTILLAAMRLDSAQIFRLVAFVIMLAAVNLLLGMVQIASGGQNFYVYKTSHMGLPLGFFANRNHVALFLLIGLVMSSALFTAPRAFGKSAQTENSTPAGLPGIALLGLMAAGIAFSFGILATNSRTVITLLVPAILLIIYLAIPVKYRKLSGILAIGGTATIGGAFALLASSGKSAIVNRLFERFGQNEDHRFQFWPDSIDAFWAYFPFGSGVTTFNIAFRPHESLDIVGTHFVNSAHNEYIEIGVETGIFGLLILLTFLLWLGRRAISLLMSAQSNREHWMALHAAFAFFLIALHSAIDYPVRRLAMMAICALLVAIIIQGRKTLPRHRITKAQT